MAGDVPDDISSSLALLASKSLDRPGGHAVVSCIVPDGIYGIDITYRVKRNKFCAAQYDWIGGSTAENRDIFGWTSRQAFEIGMRREAISGVSGGPGDSQKRHSFRGNFGGLVVKERIDLTAGNRSRHRRYYKNHTK